MSSSRPESLLGARYLFPYLIDAPEDGAIEEHGWLAGELAETTKQAAREMRRRYTRDCGRESLHCGRDRMTFACERREWLRAEFDEFDEDGEELHTRTATITDEPEEVRFRACSPDDDGALEWWVCELIDAPWRPHHWPSDLIRGAIRWFVHSHYGPRFHAMNLAERAGAEPDEKKRRRMQRRAQFLWRIERRLP